MNRKAKLYGMLFLAAFLVYRTTCATYAGRSDGEGPIVTSDGMIVHADLNSAGDTDPALEGVVEGSVTFIANIPFQKVLDSFRKPGTLGALSPNISNYKVEVASDTDDATVYKVEEEVKPLTSFIPGAPAKVYLKLTVNKRALADRTIAVKFELDPEKPNKWKRLSGRIYCVDLNNGSSMIMVASSSRSHYSLLSSLRIKAVKTYLTRTREHIVGWLSSID